MVMGSERSVELARNGSVAHLVIDNPSRRNAITERMRDAMYLALEAVWRDETIRVLVLKGIGEDFSSGADLREFGRSRDVYSARATRARRSIYRRVLMTPKPTIAAVSGAAIGGGLELVLACDVRVADPSARLGLPEVHRGFIPGGGGTQLLGRRTLAAGRLDGVVTAEIFSADEARRLGWVHEVVANRASLDRRVGELAEHIAGLDPQHVGKVLTATRTPAGWGTMSRPVEPTGGIAP